MKSAGGEWGVVRHCNEEVLFCGTGAVHKKCIKWLPMFRPSVLSVVSVVYIQDRQCTYDVILRRCSTAILSVNKK
jgi:hypothetical protein